MAASTTALGASMTGLDEVRLLLRQATQLLQSGPAGEAIDAHQRLLALRPDLPDSWFNLAHLQQRARQFDAAMASYRQALAQGVDQPEEVHLNCAVILAEQLGRADEAECELAAALALNPGYVPGLLNLGNLHEQCGDRDRALDAYQSVLAIDPTNALALARLPNLRAITGAGDPLIARLREAIERSGARAVEHADLGFALGKALDEAAAYDEAFAAYRAANIASRASAAPAHAHYDPLAHERFIDRLIRAFGRPVENAAPLPGAAQPVFICGMFRSGSSLVEQILASHPGISAAGEIDLLPAIVSEHLGPHLREPFPAIGAAKLKQLSALYLDRVAAIFPDAGMFTDKRPDNFLYIGLIKALFPHARIVHTRRHPIDNCLSVFFLHLSHAMPYALDLRDCAHWYRQYCRLMAHWKSLYGHDIHDVDYDTLVADPRPTIESLLDHLGLPWSDTCMSFHKTRSNVRTPSAWQVREPLYTRSSGRWRHYERYLGGLLAALGDQAA